MNGLMHLFQRCLQRHVALDGRQVIGKIGQLFIRDELLSLRAFDLFDMGIEIIQIVILRDKLQSRLLADPRHAGDIVGVMAAIFVMPFCVRKTVVWLLESCSASRSPVTILTGISFS